MDLRPGDYVFGESRDKSFLITRAVASGAFGIVYEVRDKNDAPFALKTISTALLDAKSLNALRNEGRLATRIVDDHVLRVLYFHDGSDYPELPPYMVMEFANGGTLKDLIASRSNDNRFFGESELLNLMTGLILGMKAINLHLVHRDIKPDNILIHNGQVKIADFGLSKVVGAATRSSTFKGIQHIRYCSPEAWNLEQNTPSMDMYSMGIVFYELATLRHPLDVATKGNIVDAWKTAHMLQLPANPQAFNPSLSEQMANTILKMIAKRPEDRYDSWDQLLSRLASGKSLAREHSMLETLVSRANESWHAEEAERLAEESKRKLLSEAIERAQFAFKEILTVVEQLIEEFNAASEHHKLQIHGLRPWSFQIGCIGANRGLIEVNAEHVCASHILDGKPVLAWGSVTASSGKGFNIALVRQAEDDLYGKWQVLHNRHNALATIHDDRPEPFPFTLGEIGEEIRHIGALHVYATSIQPFEPEVFVKLLDEIV